MNRKNLALPTPPWFYRPPSDLASGVSFGGCRVFISLTNVAKPSVLSALEHPLGKASDPEPPRPY